MGRRRTDWKTVLPKIVNGIEKKRYSVPVAAAYAGIHKGTLYQEIERSPNVRDAIEQAKLKRIGLAEGVVAKIMLNDKHPRQMDAARFFLETQSRAAWGQRTEIEMSGTVTVRPVVQLDLRAIAALERGHAIEQAKDEAVDAVMVEIDGNGDGDRATA